MRVRWGEGGVGELGMDVRFGGLGDFAGGGVGRLATVIPYTGDCCTVCPLPPSES